MRSRDELMNRVIMTIAVVGPFLGLLLGVYFAWQRYLFVSDIVLFAVMTLVLAMGVTVGYHRMLTHQGFKTYEWIRGIFLALGCMALVGSKPDEWAATHTRHHAMSDEEGDPHSPLEGFWHAHMGWLFSLKNYSYAEEFAPGLLQDRTVMFVSRWSLLWTVLPFIIPFVLGGWTGLLWGGVVRLFWTEHVTWSVNSICHTFGKRAFETSDESRNEWVIGLLAFGEGWHNNHHAFPRSAFHGLRWWQFDLSGLLIRGLEMTGLVWEVQRVSLDTEQAQRTRMQAMRSGMSDLRQSILTSLGSMRNDLAAYGSNMMPEYALADEQWVQWESFHSQAVARLDAMRESIAHSAYVKRQKLLQCQREAQRMVEECKTRWEQMCRKPVAA
ncbi:acyl-CoA desaturase [Candidatus Peribacteria bacterium]|nr:acyl-CoA desaturase [Candidatus Peribacteria bacterium]